jgi:hypothetical protein
MGSSWQGHRRRRGLEPRGVAAPLRDAHSPRDCLTQRRNECVRFSSTRGAACRGMCAAAHAALLSDWLPRIAEALEAIWKTKTA